jgi:hypothetical protein
MKSLHSITLLHKKILRFNLNSLKLSSETDAKLEYFQSSDFQNGKRFTAII